MTKYEGYPCSLQSRKFFCPHEKEVYAALESVIGALHPAILQMAHQIGELRPCAFLLIAQMYLLEALLT